MKKLCTILFAFSLAITPRLLLAQADNTNWQTDLAVFDRLQQHHRYDSAALFNKQLSVRLPDISDTDAQARVLVSMGRYSFATGRYDDALERFQAALALEQKSDTPDTFALPELFNLVGKALLARGENNLALEYLQKSYRLNKNSVNLLPEIVNSLALSGVCLGNLGKYDEAAIMLKKALQLAENKGKDTTLQITAYMSLARFSITFEEYPNALKYSRKATQLQEAGDSEDPLIQAELLLLMAQSELGEGDPYAAEEMNRKAMAIYKALFGPKHPGVALAYYQLGKTLEAKGELRDAALTFHKAIAANLPNFDDSLMIRSKPVLVRYFDQMLLLRSLLAKAGTLEVLYIKEVFDQDIKIAVQMVQIADGLIDRIRRSNRNQADKIALGPYAARVYEKGISISYRMYELNKSKVYLKKQKYLYQAFMASEKNKGGSLLGALAEIEAFAYGKVPQEVVDQEKNLRETLESVKKELALKTGSAEEDALRDRLFDAYLAYDNFILQVENDYDDYNRYKYSSHTTHIEELQTYFNRHTALRSYFIADSLIYIFTVTNKDVNLEIVPKMEDLENVVEIMRTLIIEEVNVDDPGGYRQLAHEFYKQLFPNPLPGRIKSLIIIPDANLGLLPFESFLTENYQGDPKDFKSYPYLLKKYEISYAYSANLLYRTFTKDSSDDVTSRHWLALAPVFSDDAQQGISLKTRSLLQDLDHTMKDTLTTRGKMLNGDEIVPLPGTEKEVKAILDEFNQNQMKAEARTHNLATESFVKSGALKDYEFIHIATHGFVNAEKPELSGILLAADSAGNEDGILYAGEIYTLDLNASLVVLSACETGLGQVLRGEGIIGLTRALMYAGTENIIVSLWKVADASTSDLMIDFYGDLLDPENEVRSYSRSIRRTKLKLIRGETYAHPYYWSPFILIGN